MLKRAADDVNVRLREGWIEDAARKRESLFILEDGHCLSSALSTM